MGGLMADMDSCSPLSAIYVRRPATKKSADCSNVANSLHNNFYENNQETGPCMQGNRVLMIIFRIMLMLPLR